METLTPIRETLSRPDNLVRLDNLLNIGDYSSRQQVAHVVCTQFDFHGPLGRPRLSSCNTALAQLQAAGHVVLPMREKRGARGRPRGLDEPVPDPVSPQRALTRLQTCICVGWWMMHSSGCGMS